MTKALQQENNTPLSDGLPNSSISSESTQAIAEGKKDSLSTSQTPYIAPLKDSKKMPKAPAFLQQVVRLGAMGLGMNLGPDDDRLDANWLALQAQQVYQQVLLPYKQRIIWVGVLMALDLILLVLPLPNWLAGVEFSFGMFVSLNFGLLGFALFKQIFNVYLLEFALSSKRKINSEILVLYRFLANTTILLVTVFAFAQSHQLNLIGLIASIGVGGIAIAFASQKILEQVLWSFVLYLDRPFVEDDYIHLPDRTLGRVESIGWRSTKVRLSGKGTLVVIPNSTLTQVSIENLTGAEKMISMINLTFLRSIPEQEKALIRQVILQCTHDINGLDHKLTKVTFQDAINAQGQKIVQGRVNFFVLGSGEVSREMLSHLLEVARQKISKKLKSYGIAFDLKEKTINITSPMNI
ncbi:MAG: mechanosensitive ion channel [Symploca sp. SIO2G7]|nr:mechanosensitive ion channel [Symploca sp. SIO2G7]